MSVWVRAAASAAAATATAAASLFFLFFLGEWGPVLGISLAQPIFHLKDPGHIKKKILYVFLAISTSNCVARLPCRTSRAVASCTNTGPTVRYTIISSYLKAKGAPPMLCCLILPPLASFVLGGFFAWFLGPSRIPSTRWSAAWHR